MSNDGKINDLKYEYNELCIKERDLESQLSDVKAKKIEIQREIARCMTPQQEAHALSLLYEQRVQNRTNPPKK